MTVVRTADGRQFEAPENENLLDAAAAAGITLPYSCKTGRCTTCKARVEQGATRPLHAELGLTPDESSDGWILTCVRAAESDLVLAVGEDLGVYDLAPPRIVPARINSVEMLNVDTARVTLRFPPAVTFAFRPGQHVEVIGPAGVRRAYSIANAPRGDNTVDLMIRQVEGGELSSYWFGAVAGNDLLRIHGPLGTFFLRGIDDQHLTFLVTGTGIAPVISILESLASSLNGLSPGSVTVYWGNQVADDIVWETPSHWPASWRFVPVLSRAGSDWRGARGHVQDVFLAETHDLTSHVVYACGSESMIHDARNVLVRHGLDLARFRADAFVSSSPA